MRMPDSWHQIGQRLAGTGAGLHSQVAVGLQGFGDGLSHSVLAVAAGTSQGSHGLIKQSIRRLIEGFFVHLTESKPFTGLLPNRL